MVVGFVVFFVCRKGKCTTYKFVDAYMAICCLCSRPARGWDSGSVAHALCLNGAPSAVVESD